MQFTPVSFQLTVFTNLTIENAKSIARSFDESYKKMALPIVPVPNAPWFRITSLDQSINIDLSNNRIDYFYLNATKDKADELLNFDDNSHKLTKFLSFININGDKISGISRLAINYNYFIQDEADIYKKKLNDLFFSKFFGDAEELLFRVNNQKQIDNLTFNVITDCQNAIAQNNQNLDSTKCIMFHHDINNISTDNIEKDKLLGYFTKMLHELNTLIETIRVIIK